MLLIYMRPVTNLLIICGIDFVVKIYILLMKSFFIFSIHLHLINELEVKIKCLVEKCFVKKIIKLL